MLISELIETLKKIEADYGDRPVKISTEGSKYLASISKVDIFHHPHTNDCALLEFPIKDLRDVMRL